MTRFSKQAMIAYLHQQLRHYEDTFGFTTENGWAQVAGQPENIQRAYGEFDMVQEILHDIEVGRVAS
jgi:hypothetical protein